MLALKGKYFSLHFFFFLAFAVTVCQARKHQKLTTPSAEKIKKNTLYFLQYKCYFVTEIVLTYCEKKSHWNNLFKRWKVKAIFGNRMLFSVWIQIGKKYWNLETCRKSWRLKHCKEIESGSAEKSQIPPHYLPTHTNVPCGPPMMRQMEISWKPVGKPTGLRLSQEKICKIPYFVTFPACF